MVTVIPFPVKPKESSAYAEEAFPVRRQKESKKDAAGELRTNSDRVSSGGSTTPGRGEDEGFAAVLGQVAAQTDDRRPTGASSETGSGRKRLTEAETARAKFGRLRQGRIRHAGMHETKGPADNTEGSKNRETVSLKSFFTAGRKKPLVWNRKNEKPAGDRSGRTAGNRNRPALSHLFIRTGDSTAALEKKEPGEKNKARTSAAARKAAARKAMKRGMAVKKLKGSSQKGSDAGELKPGAEESRQKPQTVKGFSRVHSFACERYETNLSRAEASADIRAFGAAGKSPDEVFGDIVRQFSFMVKKGGGEARLVLKPESLGELKLNIRLSNSQVNTHMVVETQALREMIVSRLSSLQDSLMSQGFSLGSFDVEVKDQNASNDTGAKKPSARSLTVRGPEAGKEPEPGEEAHHTALPWISTVVNITV